MQLAKGALDRKPDEQDAETLDFAIAKCQEAIAVKADGPWNPQQMLEKAKSLRVSIGQQTRTKALTRDQDLCQKALEASKGHRYREAELASCALANDSAGYSCGGDEAVNLCQELVCFCPLALLLPQPTQARCCSQLQRFCLLAAGYGKGLVKISFSLRKVAGRQR